MGVHNETSNPYSDKAGEPSQNSNTVSSLFRNQATSNSFGRQSDSVFGEFPRQNHQQNGTSNSSTGFGTQSTFGSNSFQNQGYFQPRNYGFGQTMSLQITEIGFAGFGEVKESYNFSNSPSGREKKITLVFKNPEIGIFSAKPDTRVEIIGRPTNNLSTWTSNTNQFSFSVGHVENYNSSFVMKSDRPMKFSVKVISAGSLFGFSGVKQKVFGSPLNKSGNRKITLTFQSDFTSWNNFPRPPPSTVVEIPINDDSELPHEGFAFSVGPTESWNSFEVQTSNKSVFKVTYSENEQFGFGPPFGNRTIRNGPVFFDQGRQLNPFPSSSGSLFGQPTPAFRSHYSFGKTLGPNQSCATLTKGFGQPTPAFGSHSSFGTTLGPNESCATLSRGYDTLPFDQDRPMNTIPSTGNLLFGQSSNSCFKPTGSHEPSPFGKKPSLFYNSGGELFGHPSNNVNSQPSFGNQGKDLQMPTASNTSISIFGNNQPIVFSDNSGTPAFADLRPPTCPIFGQPTNANDNSGTSAFGANHLFGNSKTQTNKESSIHGNQHIGLAAAVKYQPTISCDILPNGGSSVQTKTHCITAMKEHAHKSLEELRMESYFEEFLRFKKYKENKMTDPHRYNQESTFWGYTHSNNMIGSTTKQPFVGQSPNKCVQSSDVSNKDSFANDDKIRKPCFLGRPNDSKSANEFYEDVFKYMDYIRKQYGHLENTANNKITDNVPENHANECPTRKSDEKTKTSDQPGKQSPMPTFGGSNCSSVKIGWGENQSPKASVSKNCGTPNRVAVRATKLPSNSTAAITNNTSNVAKFIKLIPTSKSLDAADVNYGQFSVPIPVPFHGKKQDFGDKTKESEQSNDIKKPTDPLGSGGKMPSGIFDSTVSNNKTPNFNFFPMFSPKNSSNLEDSNVSNSGVATSKANEPSSTGLSLYTGHFSSTTASSDKPEVPLIQIFGGHNPNAYFSKERESLEKETNDVNDSEGLKFDKADNLLQSFETKDNKPVEPEKYNSVQLEDVPMDEQDGFKSTIQPTNPQAFKMKKISEELAALVVDGCENESKRKDSDAGSDISNYSIISNQSLNKDGKPKEHPTGIVMTRSGYYTEPSLEELKSRMTEDGRCTVSNFKIGRKGYGSVLFDKQINVAGLNVDEIVHFRNKEIIIYPIENDQLLVDADLNNCEALITLEQVWPHDKTKHEPMKNPQRLDEMKYEDKLRLVCDKNDIQFVEYLPETGRWLFKMKQFTKNNINCWDEEDDAPEILNSSTETPEIKKVIVGTDNDYYGKPSI